MDDSMTTRRPHSPPPGLFASLRMRSNGAVGAGVFSLNLGIEAPSGFTMLFGPSGAGKSTVLACLAGLVRPDEGEITLDGRILFSSTRRIDLPPQQRRVGYLSQDLALFPHMTALENVMYGLASRPRSEREHIAREMLDRFRVSQAAVFRPTELSGGERQRVALARTLVTEPDFLLLDEPLSALDFTLKSQLLNDLDAWNRERGIPIVYVTHDRDEVYALSQRVVVLEEGRIIGTGAPHDVLGVPAQLAMARIAGFENIFEAKVVAEHPELGTMTCELAGGLTLECPLGARGPELHSKPVRIAIRAGDILLATSRPEGISARNLIPGRIAKLERRESMMAAYVEAHGQTFESHLTLGAIASLGLAEGKDVWLIVKTHSCHLLRE
jgi:molybdate transport system ATP-binding protein